MKVLMLQHGHNTIKRKDNMITEASMKANKLHVMHSAKQIGKIKDDEERERQAKDLEKKAKKITFHFISVRGPRPPKQDWKHTQIYS